jgi:hypothetical protein
MEHSMEGLWLRSERKDLKGMLRLQNGEILLKRECVIAK